MIAAAATMTGSGSFSTFRIKPIAASATKAVGISTIDRPASTNTPPAIAPMAAAVTPFTNAISPGRLPHYLK